MTDKMEAPRQRSDDGAQETRAASDTTIPTKSTVDEMVEGLLVFLRRLDPRSVFPANPDEFYRWFTQAEVNEIMARDVPFPSSVAGRERKAIEAALDAGLLVDNDTESQIVRPVELPFLLTAAQVRDRPGLAWYVDGVLPERALFQIFGQTGEYKTFVVIDLLGQTSNGKAGSFLGHDVVAEPGLCCMVLGEGGGDIGERVNAWAEANPSLTDENMYFVVDQDLDLLNTRDVKRLADHLAQESARRELPWRIVLFDTQADHLPNADERDEGTFSQLKPVLLRLSRTFNCAIGLVHHTGWSEERERGSSRQRQMLDVVMAIHGGRISNPKMKAGPQFDEIQFITREVGNSLVVAEPTDMDKIRIANEKRSRDVPELRECLQRLGATVDNPATRTDLLDALSWGGTRLRLAAVSDPTIGMQSGGGRGRATTFWLIDDPATGKPSQTSL